MLGPHVHKCPIIEVDQLSSVSEIVVWFRGVLGRAQSPPKPGLAQRTSRLELGLGRAQAWALRK